MSLPLALLLPLPLFIQLVSALVNVTIDDSSSLITYAGNWEPPSTHLSSLDYGGSHTVTSAPGSSATLKFTGVAIYYLSPRWPYPVNTELTLDGGAGVVVNLTDPLASPTSRGSASATYSVLWSTTGLTDTEHNLVISLAKNAQYAIVDGFIYTVTSGSPSSPAPSPSQPAHDNHDTLPIALGASLGSVALLSGFLVLLFVCRRRRRRPAPATNVLEEWGPDPQPYPLPPSPTPFVLDPPPNRASTIIFESNSHVRHPSAGQYTVQSATATHESHPTSHYSEKRMSRASSHTRNASLGLTHPRFHVEGVPEADEAAWGGMSQNGTSGASSTGLTSSVTTPERENAPTPAPPYSQE